MINRYYVGVDPGKSGAIYFSHETNLNKDKFYLPQLDIYDHIDIVHLSKFLKLSFTPNEDELKCLIEHVWAMPKQGVTSSFNFGYYTAQVEACLESFTEVKCLRVSPQTWQKFIFGPIKTEDTKEEARKYAFEKFKTLGKTPEFFQETFGKPLKSGKKSSKVYHDGLIDAFCISQYLVSNHHKL
jgi:hypothetical protein